VELEWAEADAEDLPFEDASFDVVISSIGVMFAPHRQAAADELVRSSSRRWTATTRNRTAAAPTTPGSRWSTCSRSGESDRERHA